jgi:hypothetical protein
MGFRSVLEPLRSFTLRLTEVITICLDCSGVTRWFFVRNQVTLIVMGTRPILRRVTLSPSWYRWPYLSIINGSTLVSLPVSLVLAVRFNWIVNRIIRHLERMVYPFLDSLHSLECFLGLYDSNTFLVKRCSISTSSLMKSFFRAAWCLLIVKALMVQWSDTFDHVPSGTLRWRFLALVVPLISAFT